MQRNKTLLYSLLVIIIFATSSCQAIGDVFKTGVWAGVILVVVVIALIFWLINRAKK